MSPEKDRSATLTAATGVDARPDWSMVEELIARLAAGTTTFSSATSASNAISMYEPTRRLYLATDSDGSWIDVESVRECWATFERLGRICRRDVREPGRRSAFMMALFEQVDGVRTEHGDEPYLVLPGKSKTAA
jgi:hypothetical protein